jgi:hypothetical protein
VRGGYGLVNARLTLRVPLTQPSPP